jgi:hypothetical protein
MKLDDSTFLLYAAKQYDLKSAASANDFYEDVKRFQHLKRLFKRYHEDNDLRTRLILNHLIVIYNCFGKSATNMLFLKLKDYHQYLKPFVVFLNYMPETIVYEDEIIKSSEIGLDINIVNELRKI